MDLLTDEGTAKRPEQFCAYHILHSIKKLNSLIWALLQIVCEYFPIT